MKGIEKSVDDVGRVVLPMEFRSIVGIKERSRVMITVENGALVIRVKERYCSLCGSKNNIHEQINLCSACIAKVQNLH